MNTADAIKSVEKFLKESEDTKSEYTTWGRIKGSYRYGWTTKTRYKKWKISDVYDDLGIFDWWNDYISVSQLKQMLSFLKAAQKRGFNGYVCFKVGASGCSHGMWAHKQESTDGYSPDGAVLHHSFRSGDNYWDYCNDDGEWLGGREKWQFTLKEIDEALLKEKAV